MYEIGTESERAGMRKSAKFVLFVWQVLFIAGDQVKGSGKNVERNIATCFKKCFRIAIVEATNFLFFNVFLEQKRNRVDHKFISSKILQGIIQLRTIEF